MTLFDQPSRAPLPQPNREDVVRAAAKALAGSVPLVGGVASEVIGLLSSPVAIRRDAWLEDLARRLLDLENSVPGFRFDNLATNEKFISATLQATQAALRTHQVEKLEALRNAVANVALGKEVAADRQSVFLSLVDQFTAFHLAALRFFADPAAHFQKRGLPVPILEAGLKVLAPKVLADALPELAEQVDQRWILAQPLYSSS